MPQEVEALLRIAALPVRILAVNDLGLLRMEFQFTFRKPLPQHVQHLTSLLFAVAVDDGIVRIAFERTCRKLPLHPQIERVVQEQIRQDRAHHRTLWRPFLAMNQGAIRHADRCFEPTLDVQQHPCAVRMMAYGFHQKFSVDFIKETSDVQIEHPVLTPASLPRHGQCILCRPTGAIPIRVHMKHRFQYGLQDSLHNRLGDAIRDRWNSQRPRSSIVLRDVYPANRWRKITARRHSIPDPIEIILQIAIECRNRLAVYSRRSSVCLHPLVCFPYSTLRNTKRFCFVHRSPPLAGCSYNIAEQRHPFAPLSLQELQHYYGRLRPCVPHRYSGSRKGYLLELLPLHRDDRFLRSSLKPRSRSRRLNAGCRLDSKQVSSNLIPEYVPDPGFDIVSNFRHVVSGLLAFVFLIHT